MRFVALGGLIAATLVARPALAQGVEAEIEAMLNGLKAKSSLYAKHIPSGRTIAIRADIPMNTLSVIKIPVMIQVFRDVEAGRLKLTDRYTVRAEDLRRGSGLIQRFDVGVSLTIRDLVDQMIITSDNTATDILIAKVGLDRVNQTLASFGFTQTRLLRTTGDLFREVWIRSDPKFASLSDREVYLRGFPNDAESAARSFKLEGDSTRWLGSTTAREMSTLLEGIRDGKYASAEHSRAMMSMLYGQFYASRLPQRLAWKPGVAVAHKTGDWPPIAGNDVGIITYPGGPLVISIFTNQNTGDFFELEATEGRIAELLVNTWK
ncbi:MAG: serine hydrolase [Gemmatimonadales bacterium]